jgi:Rrf2 family protein
VYYITVVKSSRFAVATHVLVSLEFNSRRGVMRTSSTDLATSVNTNPVVIRGLLQILSRAELISTKEGSGGGVQLARPATSITLREVYEAVEDDPPIKRNDRPVHKACPVSCGINLALTPIMGHVEEAMLKVLGRTNIAELAGDIGA